MTFFKSFEYTPVVKLNLRMSPDNQRHDMCLLIQSFSDRTLLMNDKFTSMLKELRDFEGK